MKIKKMLLSKKLALFVLFGLLTSATYTSASPDNPTEGTNALDPNKPKVEFTYSCMDYPAVTEMIPEVPCISELKALKHIQCRADWLIRQELVDYYECGAKYSTGDFKAYFLNKAAATRDYMRQNQ